jgi:hypothetical protein
VVVEPNCEAGLWSRGTVGASQSKGEPSEEELDFWPLLDADDPGLPMDILTDGAPDRSLTLEPEIRELELDFWPLLDAEGLTVDLTAGDDLGPSLPFEPETRFSFPKP